MTPEQFQKLTKMERMEMVVAYAKSVGFSGAEALYWREGNEEVGLYSPFEDDSYVSLPVTHELGICLRDSIVAVWSDENDGSVTNCAFDTKEEAEAFLRQQGGAV